MHSFLVGKDEEAVTAAALAEIISGIGYVQVIIAPHRQERRRGFFVRREEEREMELHTQQKKRRERKNHPLITGTKKQEPDKNNMLPRNL